jgi:hypothetical protein
MMTGVMTVEVVAEGDSMVPEEEVETDASVREEATIAAETIGGDRLEAKNYRTYKI